MQKTKFPAVAATFIVCFVFWVLLDFSFKVEEIIAGAIVSLLVALFSARFFIREDAGWFFNPGRFFALIGFWCSSRPISTWRGSASAAARISIRGS